MRGFFITASNTDRGKTLVAAALRLWLQSMGHRTLVMKAVQTGMGGRRLSPDLYTIYSADYEGTDQASGQRPETEREEQILCDLGARLPLLQPYCYQDPCSPHLAAERDELLPVDIARVLCCVRNLQELPAGDGGCDVLLVEGAGGLYVPLDRAKGTTLADLARALGFPVLLVAQSNLGAINDSCLSLLAARHWGLELAGFLLNDLEPPGTGFDTEAQTGTEAAAYIREDNPRIIARLSGVPYLGTMPYLGRKPNRDALLQGFGSLCGLEYLAKYLGD